MDSSTLRALQAPLKSLYADSPTAAIVTLKSTSTLSSSDEGISCKLSVGQAIREAGLHKLAGGKAGGDEEKEEGVDGGRMDQLCSGDMLLEALVACAGVTLKAVSTSLSIPLKAATITASGTLDFRGTLGIDKTVPVGFTSVKLSFKLQPEDEEVGKEKLEKLVALTERYCVVLQTIKGGTDCSSELV